MSLRLVLPLAPPFAKANYVSTLLHCSNIGISNVFTISCDCDVTEYNSYSLESLNRRQISYYFRCATDQFFINLVLSMLSKHGKAKGEDKTTIYNMEVRIKICTHVVDSERDKGKSFYRIFRRNRNEPQWTQRISSDGNFYLPFLYNAICLLSFPYPSYHSIGENKIERIKLAWNFLSTWRQKIKIQNPGTCVFF